MTEQQVRDLVTNYLGPIVDAADKLASRIERGQWDEKSQRDLQAKLAAARAAGMLDAKPARTSEMSNSDTRLDPSTDWAALIAP